MHCKDISLRDVDFPLTEKSISDAVLSWNVYVRTEYLVLRNGNDLAVIRVSKEGAEGLFRKVGGVETISLPKDTFFIKDPAVDVLNVPALAAISERHPRKTIVIEGMFSHIGLILGMKVLKLRVIDNIPPAPSKLRVLVDAALSSGFIDHPIIPEHIDIDLFDKVRQVETEAAMFPCRVSGLKAEMPFYFLDAAPEIKHEVTLIGCDLSKRIYHSIYGKDPGFINVCPADAVPKDGIKTIVKCCGVKEGHVIEGNTVKVPWGATVPEVVSALNALFGNSE
ncbi:MAG: hypothetical protein FWG41_05320 [Methanomassiliicoccaceae archaeon]|nr:hypothetical protein [Methanomassiliicoccaceae archaeon]